jgi:hypothetical protein
MNNKIFVYIRPRPVPEASVWDVVENKKISKNDLLNFQYDHRFSILHLVLNAIFNHSQCEESMSN